MLIGGRWWVPEVLSEALTLLDEGATRPRLRDLVRAETGSGISNEAICALRGYHWVLRRSQGHALAKGHRGPIDRVPPRGKPRITRPRGATGAPVLPPHRRPARPGGEAGEVVVWQAAAGPFDVARVRVGKKGLTADAPVTSVETFVAGTEVRATHRSQVPAGATVLATLG